MIRRSTTVTAELPVCSFNVGGRPSARKAVRQIRAAGGHGLASIQETGDRDDVLDEVHADPFLDVVVDESRAHSAKVAAVYDTRRYELEKSRLLQIGWPRFVGRKGAGKATTQPDRFALVVYLRDLVTGRRVVLYCVHAIPSIYIPVRDELSEESLKILRRDVRKVRVLHPIAVILVVGDLNFPPDHDNARLLRSAGLTEASVALGTTKIRPTHGRRHIDHVWTRLRRFLRFLRDEVVAMNPEDHDAYVATLEVTVRPRWIRNRRRVMLPDVDPARR